MAEVAADAESFIQRASATDFHTFLGEGVLLEVDRASMLHSLEVRAPFLDHRIIEFAFRRVLDSLKVSGSARKLLLRHLARRPGFDVDRKQGFAPPIDAWFPSWKGFFEDVLADVDTSFFDRAEIERLQRKERMGRHNIRRLFALTMLELWRRRYGMELPGE